MDSMLVPILVAATVALLVFSGVRVAFILLDPERKRLKSRLTLGASQITVSAHKAITNKPEVEGLSAVLTRWSPLAAVNARLMQAFPETSLVTFLAVALGCGLMGVVLATLMLGSITLGLAGGAAGCALPFVVVAGERARRQRSLSDQLPEALDFLSRILKAGHSFSTGLQMMSDELPKPLSIEFRKAYDQHTLGQSVEDALKEMAKRIESSDFAFFVTAVLVQRQAGGDLSEVLRNISGMIRNRVRLQQHVKAKTAEGRFTGYVLVAFPLVMFLLLAVLNPKYAHTLTGTSTGHKLLGIAFGLQMLGLWSIRKITTIKV